LCTVDIFMLLSYPCLIRVFNANLLKIKGLFYYIYFDNGASNSTMCTVKGKISNGKL